MFTVRKQISAEAFLNALLCSGRPLPPVAVRQNVKKPVVQVFLPLVGAAGTAKRVSRVKTDRTKNTPKQLEKLCGGCFPPKQKM